MSLDVYLEHPTKLAIKQPTIPVREDGTIKHLTAEEWNERHPDREPITTQGGITSTVYTANITHNLNRMAAEAGLYDVVWRPDENGIETAGQLIAPLRDGLCALITQPNYYREFNPENGWGSYEGLVRFIVDYLLACMQYPDTRVRVWR